MVDQACLESTCTLTGTQGSNPCLSVAPIRRFTVELWDEIPVVELTQGIRSQRVPKTSNNMGVVPKFPKYGGCPQV